MIKFLQTLVRSMDETSEGPTVEDEELLEGQNVFKGPRKLRENLLSGDSDDEA